MCTLEGPAYDESKAPGSLGSEWRSPLRQRTRLSDHSGDPSPSFEVAPDFLTGEEEEEAAVETAQLVESVHDEEGELAMGLFDDDHDEI